MSDMNDEANPPRAVELRSDPIFRSATNRRFADSEGVLIDTSRPVEKRSAALEDIVYGLATQAYPSDSFAVVSDCGLGIHGDALRRTAIRELAEFPEALRGDRPSL